MSENPARDAFEEGYAAFKTNDLCPYQTGSMQCLNWHDGWEQAWKDSEKD